jgi:hypothetical protein
MIRRSKLSTTRALFIAITCAWFATGCHRTDQHAKFFCVANLRSIDGAVQAWALENHKTTNDIPTWSDLRPYLNPQFKCPAGGQYTLARPGGPTNLLFARAHKSLSAEQRETRLSLTPYELRWAHAAYLQRCKASGAALTVHPKSAQGGRSA